MGTETVDIILVTYNRLNFLKKTIDHIVNNTYYPYRLIVVDNGSTDGTVGYLRRQCVTGKIPSVVFLNENKGQSGGQNEGLKHVTSKYFITTQDDLLPPIMKPCWLERMVHYFEKYYSEYGSLCMRINRSRRIDWSEHDDIMRNFKSLPSVFRIYKTSDFTGLGENPFGNRAHWESQSFGKLMKNMKMKFGMITHLYADHIGYMAYNKGYGKDFNKHYTYSEHKVNQGQEQPYPDIDKSNIPVKVNHPKDLPEQKLREDYYDYWGRDMRGDVVSLVEEQIELSEYCKEGKGLDLGCGKIKCHDNAIGMDVYPHDCVDIVGDCTDLWMFKDNELDFIVNSHLLEHLPDTIAVLKEWHRVLKVGGILGIAVPDGEVKPKYILANSHRVNIGLNTLDMILRRMLNMKILKLEHVKKKKENQFVALVIAQKT